MGLSAAAINRASQAEAFRPASYIGPDGLVYLGVPIGDEPQDERAYVCTLAELEEARRVAESLYMGTRLTAAHEEVLQRAGLCQ